ncbi:MAG: phospholipid/cholesterol/gamma-HCH transport system substrate-binding protein, partial [Solirubrobacteraceae bacterium]|nr:phospholipid/cholesterol/gamma-HCH transport system substrate-binding protein [Solirubrobacteraceae bacterium]
LADALRDHRAPADLFDTIDDISPGATVGLGALRGQIQDTDLQGVLKNVARTVDALNTPRNDIRTVIQGAAATLQTTAARADDIRATLRLAPSTMTQVDATLTRLHRTLDLADPLLRKLEPAAPEVAPTFRTLRPVLSGASALLDHAVPLLRVLRPAASSLAGAARQGLPLVQQLTPSVHRLEKTTLPSLNAVAPDTQKRTSVMIGGTFAGLAAGVGGQFDGNGHFIRFPATVGSSPLDSLPCQLYLGNPDAGNQLLACQNLASALATYLNYSPVGPVPGTADGPPINTSRKGRK